MAYHVGSGRQGSVSPDILRWAQTAKYEYLACRDVRHAWPADPVSLRWKVENYQGRRVWARPQVYCIHGCGVSRIQRKDFVTREKLATQYIYPPSEEGQRSDYLLPAGLGSLSSDDIFQLQLALIDSPETTPKKRATRKDKITKPVFSARKAS